MFRRIQHVHFVGIGGIGMSGIAEVLANLGFRVSGSDLRRSSVTDRLESLGVKFCEGHAAENVGDAHVVVRTTAARDDNPEIVEARRRALPVIPRGEMLAELIRLKRHAIAVGGSHGKTTTTSMVASVLAEAKLDPTIIVGGVVAALGTNAKLGDGEYVVCEADESDRSFLLLQPTIAVVTNIDREHMDRYTDMTDVCRSFADFANKVPFYGAAVLCLDDPHVQSILPDIDRRRITYGLSAQADVSAHAISFTEGFGSTFRVWRGADDVGEITLRVPGLHNVYNALAAITIGFELDIKFEQVRTGLAQFSGVGRRFEFKGARAGVHVVDDYGHHPTEIKATLAAAKVGAARNAETAGGRLIVLFQPHRYTRTNDLMTEFARSFNNADVLMISDIYAASEDPIEGVTSEVLVEMIQRFGHKDARYIGAIESAAEALTSEAREGDMVVTLGAGSVNRVGEQLLELLEGRIT